MSGECMPKEQYKAMRAMQDYLLESTNLKDDYEAWKFAFLCYQHCKDEKFKSLLKDMGAAFDNLNIAVIPSEIFDALYEAWESDEKLTEKLGLMISYDPKECVYVAVDNTENEFFTEEFKTYEEAIAWLLDKDKDVLND